MHTAIGDQMGWACHVMSCCVQQFFAGFQMLAVLPSTAPINGRPSGEVRLTDRHGRPGRAAASIKTPQHSTHTLCVSVHVCVCVCVCVCVGWCRRMLSSLRRMRHSAPTSPETGYGPTCRPVCLSICLSAWVDGPTTSIYRVFLSFCLSVVCVCPCRLRWVTVMWSCSTPPRLR